MTPKELLNHYGQMYKAKFKWAYRFAWGKHCSMIKRLQEFYADNEIYKLMYFYLTKWQDDWAEKRGYSLESFISAIPSLIAEMRRRGEKTWKVHADYLRIEEARKKEDK